MRKIHLMSVLALSALLFSMTSTAFAVGLRSASGEHAAR